MKRKIVYITGTRADFGLMHSTLELINKDARFDLSIAVTGMHLSERYGYTVSEIEAAGFTIAARVPVQTEPATGEVMGRNIGLMLIGFVDALAEIKPDLVLVLGDRGEMLAGALAAIHLNIPVAHIHGGERSGTVDEPVRHAIAKLSHFHLAVTDEARERLEKMGEYPEHIWVTGAPGLDGLEKLASISRLDLASYHGLDETKPIALLVYHPVLQEAAFSADYARLILNVLKEEKLQILAVMPNSDAGSEGIRTVLSEAADRGEVCLVTHLPRKAFVSWMAVCDVMVGNSSSGIIEAATFGTPVINIGTRQNLRARNSNVVDVQVDKDAFSTALRSTLEQGRYAKSNIYGEGKAGERIVEILATVPLNAAVLDKCNAY